MYFSTWKTIKCNFLGMPFSFHKVPASFREMTTPRWPIVPSLLSGLLLAFPIYTKNYLSLRAHERYLISHDILPFIATVICGFVFLFLCNMLIILLSTYILTEKLADRVKTMRHMSKCFCVSAFYQVLLYFIFAAVFWYQIFSDSLSDFETILSEVLIYIFCLLRILAFFVGFKRYTTSTLRAAIAAFVCPDVILLIYTIN